MKKLFVLAILIKGLSAFAVDFSCQSPIAGSYGYFVSAEDNGLILSGYRFQVDFEEAFDYANFTSVRVPKSDQECIIQENFLRCDFQKDLKVSGYTNTGTLEGKQEWHALFVRVEDNMLTLKIEGPSGSTVEKTNLPCQKIDLGQ